MSTPTDTRRRRTIIAAIVLVGLLGGGVALVWRVMSPPAGSRRVVTLPPAEKAKQKETSVIPDRPAVIGAVSPQGWKTTSSDGTLVELLGVSPYPPDETWWKPDGTPQSQPPPLVTAQMPTPQDLLAYIIFLRVGWQNKQVLISPKVAPPGRWVFRTNAGGRDPLMHVNVYAFPPEQETIDFGIGLETPAQAFIALADIHGDWIRAPHERALEPKHGTLKFSGLRADGEGSALRTEYVKGSGSSPFTNATPRMFMYDRAGKVSFARRDDRSPLGDGNFDRTWRFDMSVTAANRLVLGVRPTQYAEFRNTSLRPGKRTKVTVIPLGSADLDRASATQP